MSTSNRDRGHFDAGTVERVLDEFRADNHHVDALFNIHLGTDPVSKLTVDNAECALQALKSTVCLALHRGNQHTEYLHYTGDGWYSATETATRTVQPIPLYRHNVEDRLGAYELEAVKVNQSPFANRELPSHDLDADADGVMLGV